MDCNKRVIRVLPLLSAIFLFAVLVSLSVSVLDSRVDRSVVSGFDLDSYLGEWEELYRSPNWFERGCTCSRAEYSLVGDAVSVVNSCYRDDGSVDTIEGTALLTGTPGLFSVSFSSWFSSEYRVLWVEDDYSVALVNGGSYLWVLVREEYDDSSVARALLEAEERGFFVGDLIVRGVCEW
jgi:apolipoprotein D and lipocalin family protein